MDNQSKDLQAGYSEGITVVPTVSTEGKSALVEPNVIASDSGQSICNMPAAEPLPASPSGVTPTSLSDNDEQEQDRQEQLYSHDLKTDKSSCDERSSRPDTPSVPSRPSTPSIPERIAMPTLTTNLGDITLHSPSSQIIGTPFATTSRFEYPFPEASSDPSSNSTSPQVSPTVSAMSPPPISSASSFPMLSTSSPIPVGPPPPISYPLHLHGDQGSGSPPSQSLFHPKHKAVVAPVPPSLIKKRPKWSLGLLGRRRSSQASQSSAGESQDTSASIEYVLGGSHRSPPLTTAKEEREPTLSK